MFRVVLTVALFILLFATPAYADDAVTTFDSPVPTVTPEPPYPVPDLPPGFGGEDFDIVAWLGLLVSGSLSGAFVAWFLEKTRLSKYIEPLPPEIKRNVTLALSGVFGAIASGLLMLIAGLPEGSVAVINALIVMLTSGVSSQVAHGRIVLHGKPKKDKDAKSKRPV